MRVLGVEIKGSDALIIILDGDPQDARVEVLSPSKLSLPPDSEQVRRLVALKKQVFDILKSNHVDEVGVIRADPGCSPLRVKVECVIQMAAEEASIPCALLASQTISAAEKRKLKDAGGLIMQQAFDEISPGYLKRPAHCAWSLMNGKSR